ncbi:MAG: gliding motility-associated C-terminal domain-containing protein, partial [bacterium]
QQLISVDIADAILGVDVDSLELEIDGVYRAGGLIVLRASDAGVSWVDPTFELDPASVDESAFGISYPSPEDTLGAGIYFPEFSTITITARAFDQMPDYCDPNGSEFVWSFEILDDDILGPEIFEFGPAYESTQNDVYLQARIADPSGVSLAELIWDDDGEVDINFNGPVAMDSVPMTHDLSDNSWIWRTTAPVGNYNSPRTITYRITATDADYDFLNPTDRTTAFADSICPILGGPVATYITPEPGEITACDNQPIVISLTDPDGVDPAPMVLRIDGELVPWGDPRLTYDPTAGELTFQPEDAWWSDMQTITVFLTLAEDSLGNPMWDTLSYSFQADLQAPAYSNEMPPAWTMIRNSEAIVSVDISDNLAGVRADELAMRIDGVQFDLSESALSWDGTVLSFAPAVTGVEFIAGDTVCITVYAGDDPDLCDPNRSEFDWCFVMEPEITCNLFPNPFTPNGDGINDFAVFDYPEMFSGDAELLIFDIRNKLIYKSTIGPVSEMGEFGLRQWRGTDNDRKSVNPGIYLYIIQKDGEVVCNGTIVLSR